MNESRNLSEGTGEEEGEEEQNIFFNYVDGSLKKLEMFKNDFQMYVPNEIFEFNLMEGNNRERGLWKGLQCVISVNTHGKLRE